MKANGMRAWRKAAKRWRRTQNRANRKNGVAWINDGDGRWYRRQRAFFAQRPVIEPRPFSPRSLVGMTQGARKRAARRCPGCIECKHEIPQRDYGLRCNSGGVFAKSPEQWRRRFKIGERLRPCPGCADCLAGLLGWMSICDGSGVLPARGE